MYIYIYHGHVSYIFKRRFNTSAAQTRALNFPWFAEVNHSWLYDEQQLLKQPDSMLKKKKHWENHLQQILPIYDAWIKLGRGNHRVKFRNRPDRQSTSYHCFLKTQASSSIKKHCQFWIFWIGIYLNDLHNLNMSFSYVIHLLTIFMAPYLGSLEKWAPQKPRVCS